MGTEKIMMKLNYLSLTLKTFALLNHFLARAIHFSTSRVGRDIQKCAGLVCGVFTPNVLYLKMIISAFPHPWNVS